MRLCRKMKQVGVWLSLILGASSALAQTPQHAKARGYFISIDGLRPDYLATLVQEKKLLATRGLGALYRESLHAKAQSITTTLTAPSHVSTITCSDPSVHGIVANQFLRDGHMVSGFTADVNADFLWQAAHSAGLKVMSFAYVGSDGRTPARKVDVSVAYPDKDLMGPSQLFEWKWDELAVASGWTLPEHWLKEKVERREAVVHFTLNPRTKEQLTYHVLLERDAKGDVLLRFALTKNLRESSFEVLSESLAEGEFAHLFSKETHTASPLRGYMRHIYLTALERGPRQIRIYASQPTYNNAQPEDFRQRLDDARLIWPEEGLKAFMPQNARPAVQLATYRQHARFLAAAANLAKKHFSYDIVLFYLPVIDSIEHSYQTHFADPFTSEAPDIYSQTLVQAFQVVDDTLSTLWQDLRPQDVVALMGDHGMDAMEERVNVAALLGKDGSAARLVMNGGLALLYAKEGGRPADADTVGALLQTRLAELQRQGKKVLGAGYRARDFAQQGKNWPYGDALWAYTAGRSFYFEDNPFDKDIFKPAGVSGMHGHESQQANMFTAFLLRAPGIAPQDFGTMSLLDAVPTFTQLMGFAPPGKCQGKPLDVGRIAH